MTDMVGQTAVPAYGKIAQGDRVFLPIIVQDGGVTPENIEFATPEGIDVLGITHIDEGCFIAEIFVERDQAEGTDKMDLKVGDKNYEIYVDIERSKL